jgi:nucleotide-binding universal stress UspA family protein
VIALRRILVPTDFSESARHALTYGISFAKEYGAEVVLLHVIESLPMSYVSDLFPVPMAEFFQEVTSYARKELADLAAHVRERKVPAREIVVQGKPAAEIVRVAREEAADMIVLGTHGKRLLDQPLFGSTIERVVRGAPCPVLSCRPAEHEFITRD